MNYISFFLFYLLFVLVNGELFEVDTFPKYYANGAAASELLSNWDSANPNMCGISNARGDLIYLLGTGGNYFVNVESSTSPGLTIRIVYYRYTDTQVTVLDYCYSNSAQQTLPTIQEGEEVYVFVIGATGPYRIRINVGQGRPKYFLKDVKVTYPNWGPGAYGNITISWKYPTYSEIVATLGAPNFAVAPIDSLSITRGELGIVKFSNTTTSVSYNVLKKKNFDFNWTFNVITKIGITSVSWVFQSVAGTTPYTVPQAPSFTIHTCASSTCPANNQVPNGQMPAVNVYYSYLDLGYYSNGSFALYYQTSTNNITFGSPVQVVDVNIYSPNAYVPRGYDNLYIRMYISTTWGSSSFTYSPDIIPKIRLPVAPIPWKTSIVFPYNNLTALITSSVSIPYPASSINDPIVIGDGYFVNYMMSYLQNNGQWSQSYNLTLKTSGLSGVVLQDLYIDMTSSLLFNLSNPLMKLNINSNYGKSNDTIYKAYIYGYPNDPTIGYPLSAYT